MAEKTPPEKLVKGGQQGKQSGREGGYSTGNTDNGKRGRGLPDPDRS